MEWREQKRYSLLLPIMKSKVKRHRKRSYKFHTITFKLSHGQYSSLKNYCKARKTTPIKLIKKNIEKFTSNYQYDVPEEFLLCEKQLTLFDE